MNEKKRARKTGSSARSGNVPRRAKLALEVYDAFSRATLDDARTHYGASCTFLMGALLRGKRFEAWLGDSDDFLARLLRVVGADSDVWDSIDIMTQFHQGSSVVEVPLPDHIKEKLLHAGGPGNLDAEDYPDLEAWHTVLHTGGENGEPK